ncbi:unnamed protein product [Ixodes pacificus]
MNRRRLSISTSGRRLLKRRVDTSSVQRRHDVFCVYNPWTTSPQYDVVMTSPQSNVEMTSPQCLDEVSNRRDEVVRGPDGAGRPARPCVPLTCGVPGGCSWRRARRAPAALRRCGCGRRGPCGARLRVRAGRPGTPAPGSARSHTT